MAQDLAVKIKTRLKDPRAWQTMGAAVLDMTNERSRQVFEAVGIPLPGGVKVSQMMAMHQALVNRVLDPESKDAVAAFVALRDTSGGKPTDKVVHVEERGTRIAMRDLLELQQVRKKLIERSASGEVQRIEKPQEDYGEISIKPDGQLEVFPDPDKTKEEDV